MSRRNNDFYDSIFGAFYSLYMEKPWLGRVVFRILWGGDSARYYESMSAIAEVEDGGTIVDCPCGAGPALRALTPRQRVRYLAVDLSPAMLKRVADRAKLRGLDVEVIAADATQIPIADDSVDLFLSYWGLHCFENPKAAVAEAARVLKPGGRLIGCCFVTGQSLRQRRTIRSNTPGFGNVGTADDVRSWIDESGVKTISIDCSGTMLFFEAEGV